MSSHIILIPVVILGGLFQALILNEVTWIVSFKDRSWNQHIIIHFKIVLLIVILSEQKSVKVVLILPFIFVLYLQICFEVDD
jgi:hypothetical protein